MLRYCVSQDHAITPAIDRLRTKGGEWCGLGASFQDDDAQNRAHQRDQRDGQGKNLHTHQAEIATGI